MEPSKNISNSEKICTWGKGYSSREKWNQYIKDNFYDLSSWLDIVSSEFGEKGNFDYYLKKLVSLKRELNYISKNREDFFGSSEDSDGKMVEYCLNSILEVIYLKEMIFSDGLGGMEDWLRLVCDYFNNKNRKITNKVRGKIYFINGIIKVGGKSFIGTQEERVALLRYEIMI